MKVFILKHFDDILYVGSSLKAVRKYASKTLDADTLYNGTCIAEFKLDSDEVKFHSTVENKEGE